MTVNYTKVPSRQGYVFMGWDEDPNATTPTYVYDAKSPKTFEMPARDVDLYAIWRPSDATKYTVQHYLCDADGLNPQLALEQEKYGTTDATVTAGYLTSFTGYEPYPQHTGTVASGVVAPDGSLVLKLYYKLSVSTLTIAKMFGVLFYYIGCADSLRFFPLIIVTQILSGSAIIIHSSFICSDFLIPSSPYFHYNKFYPN